MTSPQLNEAGGSTPRDLPVTEPRQGSAQTLQNVDARLTDLQVGHAELQISLKHVNQSIENAKLPDMVAKIDQLNRTVDAAKLSELAFKIDNLIKSVEGAKLTEMASKLESVKQSADSTKGKVEGLVNVKAMVIGGFAVLTVMLGIIGWIVKSGFDLYNNLQPKLAQSHMGQPLQYGIPPNAAPQAAPPPQTSAPSTGSDSKRTESSQ